VLKNLFGGAILALVFWGLSLLLFGMVTTAANSGPQHIGVAAFTLSVIAIVESVLAFPFMYLDRVPGGLEVIRSVFGDDSRAVIGLSALSSLFWALVTMVFVGWWRRRPSGT
jgi:hypothetical protein